MHVLAAQLVKDGKKLQAIFFDTDNPEYGAFVRMVDAGNPETMWHFIPQSGLKQHLRLKGKQITTDPVGIEIVRKLHKRGWETRDSAEVELLPEEVRALSAVPKVPGTLLTRIQDALDTWNDLR